MNQTLYQIFQQDPKEALEEQFRRERARLSYLPEDVIFCWTSVLGIHGEHRYGVYRNVTRKELEGRQYDIEYWDGRISIFFTDVVHDPKTYKNIAKEMAQ